MNSLPPELIDVLVSKFSRKVLGKFATLSLAARRLASKSESSYVSLKCDSSATDIDRAGSFALWLSRRRLGSIASLVYENPKGASLAPLEAALVLNARGLKSLHLILDGGGEIVNPVIDIGRVAEGLPNLVELSVSGGAEFQASSPGLRHLTSLESLCILGGLAHSEDDDDEMPYHLGDITRIPRLEDLVIENIAGDLCACQMLGKMRELRTLRLTGTEDWSPIETVGVLRDMTNIREISIGASLDVAGVDALRTLTALTALSLCAETEPYAEAFYDDDHDATELMDVVESLKNLEYFACTRSSFAGLRSDSIKHLAVSPYSLEDSIKEGFRLENVPNLERLTISGIHQIDDADMAWLSGALGDFLGSREIVLEFACMRSDIEDSSTRAWVETLAHASIQKTTKILYTVAG